LNFNTTGNANTAVGRAAMWHNTTGGGNTAIGNQSMINATTGAGNTAVGMNSLAGFLTGLSNTAIGTAALLNNADGSNNVALGSNALNFNQSGFSNVAIGNASLYQNLAHGNSAIGYQAMRNNTSGYSNVAFGLYSLYQNTTSSNLVAIGDSALHNNGNGASFSYQAIQNTAIGSKALFGNTTGSLNTAVGYQTMRNSSAGSQNTALGFGALSNSNTTGSDNIAIGVYALYNNNTGNNNVSVGDFSLMNNQSGYANTAIGLQALNNNNAGENTAVGYNALINNSNGTFNAALGATSAQNNNSGSQNTAVGYNALGGNTSGNYNTAIGFNTLNNASNLSNAIAIGALARVDCSNCMVLGSVLGINGGGSNVKVGIGTTNPLSPLHIRQGNSVGTAPFGPLSVESDNAAYIGLMTPNGSESGLIFGKQNNNASGGIVYNNGFLPDGLQFRTAGNNTRMSINSLGQVGIGTNSPTQALHVVGNVCATGTYLSCSDVRYKKDFIHIDHSLESILSLNGVYYHWRSDEFPEMKFNTERQIGFSAQEVEKLFPEIVKTGPDGYKSVDYGRLTPVLVEAIKEQQKKIDNLEQQLNEVKALLTKLVKQ